jgi:tRNA G10  N-methylase Trm11
MFIVILGRQPALGTAEIEAVYGAEAITPLLSNVLLLNADYFDINRFGGVKKAGKLLYSAEYGEKNDKLKRYLLGLPEGKLTLGFSYFSKDSLKTVQKNSLNLKNALKKQGRSVRLVPQDTVELSTAVSHHNKLGLSPNKVEVITVGTKDKVYVAVSTGAQNITAYAARDQKRPKRDAFVGMLPPKLAQIIINLALGSRAEERAKEPLASARAPVILDPFCGTGVILQEALLMGYKVYGTDLSPKMIDYSEENLKWLVARNSGGWRSAGQHPKMFLLEAKNFQGRTERQDPRITLEPGDATKFKWQPPINAIASEVYLGQPFSAIPSDAKLAEVRRTCRAITTAFLANLAPQIQPGTSLCLAVPAWRTKYGWQRLDILDTIENLGYNIQKFQHVKQQDLLYHREDQIVGRELLVLKRS